ncbi:unnamed protein product [Meloidogyne enterolobii]|uniref:Uncharacterized protein n=1 Tax=Meloidogyne enterolobii TaxID=390850 RepID=A0ACB0XPB8_MELEN
MKLKHLNFLIFILFIQIYQTFCLIPIRWHRRDPVSLSKRLPLYGKKQMEYGLTKYKWNEEFYEEMPVDHFSFNDPRKFKLRYLINTDNFKEKNAPIFFYTGNEGSIEGFAENTGFMWDIAPEFGAAIVFAEHRYYGKSYPFGNDSYSSVSNLGYLSSEQALADFAVIITYLKEVRLPHAKKSPVIAFGGSYGGMLTAWMRIKYPHIIDGGIAASAPVFWFGNVPAPPEHSFDDIVTRTFINSGCTLQSLSASFETIRKMADSSNGRKFLNEQFHLSSDSQVKNANDGEELIYAIQSVLETMAMVDYPYPSNFLAPLPAWPVKVACKAFISAQNPEQSALASYKAINLFYNYTGSEKTLCLWGDACAGPFSALGDPDGWPWQACTEMIMPMCSRGPPFDPFNKSCPFRDQQYIKYCLGHFSKIGYNKDLFRPNWAITNYGVEFPTATNIVFSNGWLDPWSGGGWRLTPTFEGSLYSLIVEDGAHHYDLRGEHPDDTQSVKEVRRLEKKHITRWIKEAREKYNQQKRITKDRILYAEIAENIF